MRLTTLTLLALTTSTYALPQWVQWNPPAEEVPNQWWTPSPTPTPTLDTTPTVPNNGGITTIKLTSPPTLTPTSSASSSSSDDDDITTSTTFSTSSTSTGTSTTTTSSSSTPTMITLDENMKVDGGELKNATEFTQFMTKGKGTALTSDGGEGGAQQGKEKVWWVLMAGAGVVGMVWGV
ncbi:hypothetical protein BJ508DRAFT_321518 [Ascobolus immersus RN42]|uniref:Mid2 domain-containing protein n=1 Tax=Ascobolus immersus RN42 TaxID=1160509 RepID=A0A3N4ILE3_ASCIM|nr:hypothetical protein BJ508DRAFT_321518 [Ascobolus immersus RN42]